MINGALRNDVGEKIVKLRHYFNRLNSWALGQTCQPLSGGSSDTVTVSNPCC